MGFFSSLKDKLLSSPDQKGPELLKAPHEQELLEAPDTQELLALPGVSDKTLKLPFPKVRVLLTGVFATQILNACMVPMPNAITIGRIGGGESLGEAQVTVINPKNEVKEADVKSAEDLKRLLEKEEEIKNKTPDLWDKALIIDATNLEIPRDMARLMQWVDMTNGVAKANDIPVILTVKNEDMKQEVLSALKPVVWEKGKISFFVRTGDETHARGLTKGEIRTKETIEKANEVVGYEKVQTWLGIKTLVDKLGEGYLKERNYRIPVDVRGRSATELKGIFEAWDMYMQQDGKKYEDKSKMPRLVFVTDDVSALRDVYESYELSVRHHTDSTTEQQVEIRSQLESENSRDGSRHVIASLWPYSAPTSTNTEYGHAFFNAMTNSAMDLKVNDTGKVGLNLQVPVSAMEALSGKPFYVLLSLGSDTKEKDIAKVTLSKEGDVVGYKVERAHEIPNYDSKKDTAGYNQPGSSLRTEGRLFAIGNGTTTDKKSLIVPLASGVELNASQQKVAVEIRIPQTWGYDKEVQGEFQDWAKVELPLGQKEIVVSKSTSTTYSKQ